MVKVLPNANCAKLEKDERRQLQVTPNPSTRTSSSKTNSGGAIGSSPRGGGVASGSGDEPSSSDLSRNASDGHSTHFWRIPDSSHSIFKSDLLVPKCGGLAT